ncbi:MAG: hypothetical protein ABEJ77_00950 [Halanaeroarchaeum sp.]
MILGGLLIVGNLRGDGRAVPTEDSDLSLLSVFGGTKRRVTTDASAGGSVVSLFGGSEIDLRDAAVADPPAVIEAVSLFGGLDLRVPEEWAVSLELLTLFGAAEDSRPRAASGEPIVVVTGLTLFGGVEVLD